MLYEIIGSIAVLLRVMIGRIDVTLCEMSGNIVGSLLIMIGSLAVILCQMIGSIAVLLLKMVGNIDVLLCAPITVNITVLLCRRMGQLNRLVLSRVSRQSFQKLRSLLRYLWLILIQVDGVHAPCRRIMSWEPIIVAQRRHIDGSWGRDTVSKVME